MLKLQGIHLGEDVTADDPDFLMEIMEINEEVADASIDQLKEIQSSIKAILSKLTLQIAREFHDNNFEMAKQHLIKFKYYNNIDEKLKEIIPPV
uniref:Co-chaperone HscB C-terminal oligomerisation domain-containing protein n=1 Tax=Ciona savignyi TaxID=51511 RepID=H2ZBV1_CIOSA